jgi:adenylylsulfate kinase
MPDIPANIHPVSSGIPSREVRETRYRQRARVIWCYGLSGSGKSTLAVALARRLHAEGFIAQVLDGDNLRTGLNRDLGFSETDRAENIRRGAEAARLFLDAGIIVVAAFITPTRALRQLARSIIGSDDFVEVYVEAAWGTCERRDPKGLYAKAGQGRVAQFTGRDAPFEPAERADLVVNTDVDAVEQSLERLYRHVRPLLEARAG